MSRLLVDNAHHIELPDVLASGTSIVAGSPSARGLDLGSFGDVAVGIWQLSAGHVRDVEADEIFVVLSGRGEVRFEDGSAIALVPGAIVRLRDGDRTEWIVTETLRKVYISG